MASRDLIEELTSKGRYSFTSEEARRALKVSPGAAKQALHRLAGQGLLASPARGFYVIVPPEYRSLGCLPAEQFIPDLMAHKGLSYYAGLLSAAQYHGAAHQRPQEFQVFLRRSQRPIQCGKVRIRFMARQAINKVPVQTLNTPRGEIRISTPEATAIDLAGYPMQAGGYGHVVTVLKELAEVIDGDALAAAATTAPVTWSQRLGHLLELTGSADAAADLKEYVRKHAHEYTKLVPSQKSTRTPHLPDWKLIPNAIPESDLL